MPKINPSLPSGMRDFTPVDLFEREYIIKIIEKNFKNHGYEKIETSSIENIDVLKSKYGTETNKLIFKILNSGDFLKKCKSEDFIDSKKLEKKIVEKALRYDLTVPLARYISKNKDKHVFPFKRYQIQTVWRADRPQKGRYREFCQCDADILGTKSILAEFEIISSIYHILLDLGIFQFKIRVSHREIFKVFISKYKLKKYEKNILNIIDNIDKVGIHNSLNELKNIIDDNEKYNILEKLLDLNKNEFHQTIQQLTTLLENREDESSETLLEALEELNTLFNYLEITDHDLDKVVFDTTIIRGLEYYTGIVFEVTIEQIDLGSIGGGGRYDGLTSHFLKESITGVGFSFGLERLWYIMKELDLLPKYLCPSQILITNLSDFLIKEIIKIDTQIQKLGVISEIYYDVSSLKKQLKFADKKNIPYVLIYGENEYDKKELVIKCMLSGNQRHIKIDNLKEIVKFILINTTSLS